MLVLITYDVNTQTVQGVRRLSKIAKICTNYGRRVQNSVFECLVDNTQLAMIRHQIEAIINYEEDSVRFYMLGNQFHNRVDHIGKDRGTDMSGVLLC